jgi:hypothetical protein
MKTIITIKLIAGHAMQTVYEGTSRAAAQKVVDMLRGALIISGGTAGIYVRFNNSMNTLLWKVENGEATCPEGSSPLA